jgi:hypothetical protein
MSKSAAWSGAMMVDTQSRTTNASLALIDYSVVGSRDEITASHFCNASKNLGGDIIYKSEEGVERWISWSW